MIFFTEKYLMEKSKPEIGDRRKIYCNNCKNKTHHELKFVQPQSHFEESEEYSRQISYWEKTEQRLWVCLGCDASTLELAYTSAGMQGPDENDLWDSTYYPKRDYSDLPRKRFRRLDRKLSKIYGEVIECFNSRLEISCAIGLRALLEGICAEKGIKAGNLSSQIDQLDQYLPTNIVKNIHGFRFMGNLAAHELEAPNERELRLAIEVMEDILNILYELDYKSARLWQKRDKQ
jgi:hypothetical protein